METYDCAIVGGGVSGLCLATQLARAGRSVILFEKNRYPFHKVCGEYISLESWDFLEGLGLPLSEILPPQIRHLGVSGPNGKMIEAELPLGGFGISRHTLDEQLCRIARNSGAIVMDGCKVQSITSASRIVTSQGEFGAKLVCGSFGKYYPAFLNKPKTQKEQNYIGVKYHVRSGPPADRIELHNFSGGYCGISKIDNDRYCLCYLTTAANLARHGNDMRRMEASVLMKNPKLAPYLDPGNSLFERPVVISQVSFQKKAAVNSDWFMLGDAAGSIAPLCGNGMSMGMRASKMLTAILLEHLEGRISLSEAQSRYRKAWDDSFSLRIKTGYYLQQLLGKNVLTNATLGLLGRSPKLFRKLISLTHGKAF